jgi:hypothetical protein
VPRHHGVGRRRVTDANHAVHEAAHAVTANLLGVGLRRGALLAADSAGMLSAGMYVPGREQPRPAVAQVAIGPDTVGANAHPATGLGIVVEVRTARLGSTRSNCRAASTDPPFSGSE